MTSKNDNSTVPGRVPVECFLIIYLGDLVVVCELIILMKTFQILQEFAHRTFQVLPTLTIKRQSTASARLVDTQTNTSD